jgi:hypothetical protein
MMSKRVGVTWERSLRLHASQLFFHLSWALLRKLEGEITEMTLLYISSVLLHDFYTLQRVSFQHRRPHVAAYFSQQSLGRAPGPQFCQSSIFSQVQLLVTLGSPEPV